MLKSLRVANLIAWTLISALVMASAAPDVRADDAPANNTKNSKSKPASKKAVDKKAAEDKADAEKAAEKAKADQDTEEFTGDNQIFEHKATKAEETTAKSEEKPSSGKAKKTIATVVQFNLKGEYPEGPSDESMFGSMQPSLGKLIERIEAARDDKEVKAIWLRLDELEVGRGKVNEIRAAIAGVRKAGKPVYAELTSAETGPYLIASACDYIFMPTSGVLTVPGVRMEVTFYKGLLDKLGLKFDALRMGKYKGFVEPYSRENMSGPLRESLQSLVDDTYDHMVATIAKDRHLEDYKVKTLIDRGLFTATAAQDGGLIDEVMYADQFQDSLAKRLKVDRVEVDTSYKKKQLDTDFSGMGGFVKLMEAFSGGKKLTRSGNKQRIAVVYAVGEIAEGKSESSLFGGSSLGSATMVETLKKAFDDPKVVAVVLRIDSPGGSATASDLIWRETVRVKKPFVASMGDVAGSGGYYIAMGAQKIYAEPGTLTGSIGVGGGKLVTGGLYDKVGLNTEIISRGKNSGALSSTQPFSEDERKVFTQLLQETYHDFVSKAAQGRKMDYEKVDAVAQGRVYTGSQAKKLGLVDELGTLADAIDGAKKLAGLKPGADVDIEILPEPKSIFEQLFGGEGVDTDELTGALSKSVAKSLSDAGSMDVVKTLRQVSQIRRMLGGKVQLWMPYHIELK